MLLNNAARTGLRQYAALSQRGGANSGIVSGTSISGSIVAPGSSIASRSGIAAAAGQTRNYHESVIDHFNNPRNVGKLDATKKNVGSALVGKASCGDVIKLQIEVAEDGKTIKDAKFKTFGCGSAIASSSLATEMIMGKDIAEAAKLKNTDISTHLSLPPVKIHCSVLAEEAIQAAIKDYQTKQRGESE